MPVTLYEKEYERMASEPLQAEVHAFHIDTLRLLGEALAATPRNEGAKGSIVTGSKRVPVKDETPTLAELGISKKTSSLVKIVAHRQLGMMIKDVPKNKSRLLRGNKVELRENEPPTQTLFPSTIN